MESRSWKIIGVLCLFASSRLLYGLGVIALLMACFENSLQRAAVGAICLIGSRILWQKWTGITRKDLPPDAP